VQFVDNHFVESYNPTIENTFVKELKYKGVNYSIELVDTAGQVRRIRELDILQCGRSIKLACSQSHSQLVLVLVCGIRYRNDPLSSLLDICTSLSLARMTKSCSNHNMPSACMGMRSCTRVLRRPRSRSSRFVREHADGSSM